MTEFDQYRVEMVHTPLKEILGSDYVYFEPPTGFKLSYPCIIYELNRIDKVNADDKKYLKRYVWSITVIDNDANTDLPDKILDLPYCTLSQRFVNERLVHNVFTLYTT